MTSITLTCPACCVRPVAERRSPMGPDPRYCASKKCRRERQAAYERSWEKRHPERRVAARRAWRKRNREKDVAYVRAWRKRHPEKSRAAGRRETHKRRARKRNQLGAVPVPADILDVLWKAQAGECWHCGVDLDCVGGSHLDHLRPLAMGGLHETSNLALSCPPCNMKRGAREDAGPGPLAVASEAA